MSDLERTLDAHAAMEVVSSRDSREVCGLENLPAPLGAINDRYLECAKSDNPKELIAVRWWSRLPSQADPNHIFMDFLN